METKKFISTLKGFRTKFSNTPNIALELKTVENLCEKFGGKLEVMATLKENNSELLAYVRKVFGIVRAETPLEKPTIINEIPVEEILVSEPITSTEEIKQCSVGKDGQLYEIDAVKKTCKRVFKDLKDIKIEDVEVSEMSMTTYQRYLKDKFPGEGAQIKKGKLHFRGYRISCDTENGFMIEDSTKRYAVVETSFEGIPTPKELGEFFNRPRVEHTPEELTAAVERGKELAKKAKEESERNKSEESEIDFEELRLKVLGKITAIREKKLVDFAPDNFSDMIPFRRWKLKVTSLLKDWKSRKIRYQKFLSELEKATKEETFEVKEKNHRSSFVGAILPEFKTVGLLHGDKIEVDGKLTDAVPFMLDYILHYEPRAMQQLMRFSAGVVDAVFLLKNPLHVDGKIVYDKKSIPNTALNAQILTALCESVGIVAPQDALYEADLAIGDKILIFYEEEWKTKTILQIDKGICINNEVGLTKLDKWIKLPNK